MINNALVEKTIYISLWAQFITTTISLDGLNYDLAIEDTIDLPVNLTIVVENYQIGDVNLDGEINVLDVVMIVAYILGSGELTETQIEVSDYNGDSYIDVLDVVMLVGAILGN